MYEDIIAQMRQNGVNPPESLEPSQKIIRFKVDEKDQKESGWYIGFRNQTQSGIDFFNFLYGDHHDSGVSYIAKSGVKLDKFDKKRSDEQINKAKRLHHLQITDLHKKAAEKANKVWESLPEGFGKNEYLERKGFGELYGARINGFNLVVPMRGADGQIKNLETIYGAGSVKNGLYGGERNGLFHQIGEIRDVIYLAEGFSTAVAIHLALRQGTICCFNSGNLPHVAQALSKKYPDKKIIVCGDNDQFSQRNTGAIESEKAANICGGKWVIPQFKDLSWKDTDFWDLDFREPGQVKIQIEAINPTELIEILDESYVLDSPYPHENQNPKGGIKRINTIENLETLIHRLRSTVRYNVISKLCDIRIPGQSYSIDNEANATLAEITSWCQRAKLGTENLGPYILRIADRNQYNPVVSWIDSVAWDGVCRLQDFCDTVTAAPDKQVLKEILIRKWLLSAVALAYSPTGESAAGILVFQGLQGMGKTAWFKRLVPQDLNLTADGVLLRPDNKDSVAEVVSKWIIELGELDATFKKTELAQLKAFVSKSKDIIRNPYDKRQSTYPRRTVFFGSVNEEAFLKDNTGNRRFWTVPCVKINYQHNINMQQLWAEIRQIQLNSQDKCWNLTVEENDMLNDHNEQFLAIDPIEERIRDYFPWQDCGKQIIYIPMNATAVCLKIGILNPTNKNARDASLAIQKISGQKQDRHRKYNIPIIQESEASKPKMRSVD